MNILIVSAQFPYPTRSGFTTRVYQLARHLAARHSVTVLSYAEPHERGSIAGLGTQMSVRAVERKSPSPTGKRVLQALTVASPRSYNSREVHSKRMQRAIDDVCSTKSFDVIQLESSFLCTFRFPRTPRLVIDEHNIEYELFKRTYESERSLPRRAFNHLEYLRFRRFEQKCWARVDACVVTSEREVEPIRSRAPETPVVVVPNAVDVDHFTPTDTPVEPHTVLFTGTLNYRPNLDGVRYLIDEVWPLVRDRYPDARLTLTGRSDGVDTRSLMRPGVEFMGEVPDIRSCLGAAAVVAVPIRFGGGTRLKVVEGLAMGKAMVSTTLGCEGVAVRDGQHLLIADDAAAFASKIGDVFENPALGHVLGRAGRRLIETQYSWELAGARLEALYNQIAGEQPGRSTQPEFVGAEA
jgi:polysaccharide biosynthesis protein PslH